MRITIVQGAFLPVPPLMGGALEKAWLSLGKTFAARGHSVTHVSRRHPDLPDSEVRDGVRHLRVRGHDAPGNMAYLKWLDLLYSRRVTKVLPEADILVTHTFWLPLVARNPRHGAIYVHVGRYPKGQLKFYRRARRLQTISSPIAEAIAREVPQRSEQIITIPLPLPEAAEVPISPLSDRPKVLCYVGRIHPEKGLHVLIEAFRKLPEALRTTWRLRIIGPHEHRHGGGGEAYLDQLKSLLHGNSGQVEWVPPIFEHARLLEEYRQSRIFLYPSLAERGETLGLAPLEAMSCGCVPLLSSLECFLDFLIPGRNGEVFNHRVPDPAHSLAQQLERLLADPASLDRMSEEARKSAAGYAVDVVADRYLEDFGRIINER